MFRAFVFALAAVVCAVAPLSADENFPVVKIEEVDAGMPYKIPEVPATDPQAMKGLKIAIVAAHGFEEVEVTYPLRFFKARGATVDIVTPDWIKDRVMAVQFLKPSIWLPVAKQVSQVKAADYCAYVVPGGAWNPIIMRTDGKILDLLRQADDSNKLIASVCHGPQVLLSAGLLKDKEATGVGDIRSDMRAGGVRVVEDQPVVIAENILTSRDPNDLAEFSKGIEAYLKKNLKFCHGQGKHGGEGAAGGDDPNVPSGKCPNCLGTGKITGGAQMTPRDCPECGGTGKPGQRPGPSGH